MKRELCVSEYKTEDRTIRDVQVEVTANVCTEGILFLQMHGF